MSLVMFGCALASAGCSSAPPNIRVAAAADLQFVLPALVADFAKVNPEIRIEPIFGSSGNLSSQIANGAPFDLFLSADLDYPRKMIQGGQGDLKSLFVYSVGHLVLWVPKSSSLDVERLQIGALTDDSVRKIAIANPQHAPYGRAAEAMFQNQAIADRVAPKLVMGENIGQALEFVRSGSADLGVISLSQALAPSVRDTGRFWRVPDQDFPLMEQGGVIMRKAHDQRAAHLFSSYLLTPRAREIFKEFGFTLPEP